MGAIALTAAPAAAVDVGGGLEIGGFVDSILQYKDVDVNPDAIVDFATSVELQVGYSVGEAVSAQIDLEFADTSVEVNVEQAYINWVINDSVDLTMGRFESYVGWEAIDAPGLWRVNNSLVYGLTGNTSLDGLAINFTGSDDMAGLSASVFVADSILAEAGKLTNQLSFGVDVTYAMEDMGVFGLDFAYDSNESDNNLLFGLNAEITKLSADMGLTFAIDFEYTTIGDVDATYGILGAVKYDLSKATELSFPMAVSLMVDTVMDQEADTTNTEIAVALLTNPTSEDNFGVNLEIQYVDYENDDDDTMGVYLEWLAVLP
jgi:hypothetical protein